MSKRQQIMIYSISYNNPLKRYIDIELTVTALNQDFVELRLPAWRPGRYETQNYSKNIQSFSVEDETGKYVEFTKSEKEKWSVKTTGINSIIIKYNYYAYQMDAGGCWLDEEQLYLNFICCLLYVEGRQNEPCEVNLNVNSKFQIACGLKQQGRKLIAKDYFELVDCPLIASCELYHKAFNVKGVDFHIWVQGKSFLKWDFIIDEFKRYIEEQIETMGEFPEKDYHFLYQILPYRIHHGVEHRNSTVITIGPGEILHNDPYYIDFLSISCHELFHAWNIIKIRPKELLPYDFAKENYFKTGFIVEGITTYYGEYFLARAGVFNQEQYFNELNLQLKKHFENNGNYNLSLADSSFDLWVDGYVQGVPNRKVSIYIKGAIVALLFDIEIRKRTFNNASLDDVMVYLWNNFGKKSIGYTIDDFLSALNNISSSDFTEYFTECVYGRTDLKTKIQDALNFIGCSLEIIQNRLPLEKYYGLRTMVSRDGRTLVESTDVGSPSEPFLSKDDEIISIDSFKVSGNANELCSFNPEIEIHYFRKNRLGKTTLSLKPETYYKQFRIFKKEHATPQEKENFLKWLKSDW